MNSRTFGTPALLATMAKLSASFCSPGSVAMRSRIYCGRRSISNAEKLPWPPERTKNGLVHVLPVSAQILAILQQTDRIAGREFLFGEGPNAGFQAWSRSKRM